jgi:hypothetical protein
MSSWQDGCRAVKHPFIARDIRAVGWSEVSLHVGIDTLHHHAKIAV